MKIELCPSLNMYVCGTRSSWRVIRTWTAQTHLNAKTVEADSSSEMCKLNCWLQLSSTDSEVVPWKKWLHFKRLSLYDFQVFDLGSPQSNRLNRFCLYVFFSVTEHLLTGICKKILLKIFWESKTMGDGSRGEKNLIFKRDLIQSLLSTFLAMWF